MDTNSFEQFREELRDMLAHLHDPDYQPPESLCRVLGCEPTRGAASVQSAVIHLIRSLEPALEVPADARIRRDFDLLNQRFVLGLTQEETADRMGIGVRSLRRAQREATHMAARVFWEHNYASATVDRPVGLPESAGLSADWRAQVEQDLASLQQNAPGAVADVAETVARVLDLERGLAAQQGFTLSCGRVEPGLVAAIHPAALRQVLIMTVGQIARSATEPGEIRLDARREGDSVSVIVQGPGPAGARLPESELIQRILASQGGALVEGTTDGQVAVRLSLKYAGQVTVLVIDDNLDMVHYLGVCVSGTKYHVLPAPQGQRTAQHIEALAPDVIVLDIILPDIDGWELLRDLQEHPRTRAIPVIVCSIVREEHLASALGAALYLPKPVKCGQFLQALDWALGRAPAAASGNPTTT